jgi:outer membrane lipoprotein-sorting protein
MKTIVRSISSLSALSLGVALLGAAPVGAAATFLEAWAKVPSYTANIKVHATKGTDVQDRTYRYAYLKPHFAKIDITGGPGRGGGAVWSGGDTVSGHQGGILSGIHLKVSIHDGRAVDLRGGTIDEASFENVAENIKMAASAASGEETVGSIVYDTVTVPFKDVNGATKRTIFLSKVTHLPTRRLTYSGDAVVLIEDFSDVNITANLKESDF